VSKSVFEVSLDPEHLVVESGSIGIKYLNGYHLQNENYQAPEFMHSRLVNQSSLVWTLGCVLVFLLTGSEPFQSTGKGFLKFEVLDKDFRARTLDNEKLAEVREILQKIFKIKQSRRISIEMLLVLIQNI
jgi:serine/threonine protein kinase